MSEFVDFLTEVFEHFGPVEARKMFSGYGLYHDGVMFGLIADEVLYLKADAAIARHFEARGLEQFSYKRGDKVVKMSYYLAPEEIYEDREAAAVWARRSFEAAYRASRNKPGKSRKQK
ncbi:MAG TPA: TfoX/Sxy family protein [Methylophilaceae bacterium]|nr:TfoX/Sxy family protein [Methylophilaceae bacterium]